MGRNTSLLAVLTLVSRLTGQARLILLVAAIGATGMVADAFDIANNVPATLNLLLTGGIFNAILLPQFMRAKKFKNADEITNKLLSFCILTLFGITFILTVLTPFIVSLIANSNWTSGQLNLAIMFGFFCMPQVFFYGLYTVLGQILATKERFGMFGFAPVFNNIISCAMLLIYIVITGGFAGNGADMDQMNIGLIILLGFGSTLGIVAQALLLVVPLRRSGFKFRLYFNLRDCGLRRSAHTALWSFLTILVQEVVSLGIVSLVSGAPEQAAQWYSEGILTQAQVNLTGGNAAYSSGLIIYIIPHSLITVSLATTIFARITKLVHDDNLPEVGRQFTKTLRLDVYVMTAFTILLLFLSVAITRVLIPSTTDISSLVIGEAVIGCAIRLVPTGISQLSTRVFFAFEKVKLFFMIDVPCQILTIVLCVIASHLIGPMSWLIMFGFCTAIAYWLESFVCLRVIKNNLLPTEFDIKGVVKSIVSGIICSVPGIILILIITELFTGTTNIWSEFTTRSWFDCLIYCIISTVCFGVSYLGCGVLFRSPDALFIWGKAKSVLRIKRA